MKVWNATALITEVNAFWFGEPESPEFGHLREAWFRKDTDFDQQIHDRFGDAIDAAGRGDLQDMAETPLGTLALLVLLDQFTRNTERGTGRMYANDEYAIQIADAAILKGFDLKVNAAMRQFFYMPYEHSENLGRQNCSVALFEALGNPEALKWAVQHRDIIVRFGRFPHRNAHLNRPNTAEEEDFLKQAGSSF